MVDAGRFAEAEPILRARIAAHEAARRSDTPEWAADAQSLATVLTQTRRAAEAEPLMRAALRIRERSGEPAALGRALNQLANLLGARGDARASEVLARRAIAVLAPVPAANDRLVAAWGNLGFSLESQGWHSDAIEAFDTGISIGRDRLGPNSPIVQALAGGREASRKSIGFYAGLETKLRLQFDAAVKTNGRNSAEAAKAMDVLANVLGRQGKYDEAEALARESLAILEATPSAPAADTRAARFGATKLLRRRVSSEAAGVEAKPGSDPAAMPAAKPPPAYSEDEIRAMILAGGVAEAEAIVRARIAADKAAGRDATPEATGNLNALAQVYASTGRLSDAETQMREVLSRREREGDPGRIGRALSNLAFIALERDDFRATETLARRATAALRAAGHADALANAWSLVGSGLAGQRRRPEASAAFEQAIAIRRAAPKADPLLVVETYNSLALNLDEMGNLKEGEAIYRRNLDTIVQAKGRGHLDTARTLGLLATNLERQQRDQEAEAPLLEAILIRRRALGSGSPATIHSQGNLASLMRRLYRFDEAEALEALNAGLRAALPDRGPEAAAFALLEKGRLLRAQRRLPEAIDVLRQARAAARDTLDPGHAIAADAAAELARALMAQQPKSDEYVTVMREAVAAARRESLRNLSPFAASGSASAGRAVAAALGGRGEAGGGNLGVYRLALSANGNYATVDRSVEARLRAESFMVAQDAAATATGRALAGVAVRESLGDTPLAGQIRRQQDLAEQVGGKHRELVAALANDPPKAARLRAEIDALGLELAAAHASLRRAYPDYARLVAPAALGVDEVRKRLKPGEGLLLVVEGELYNFSFAVSRKGIAWTAAPQLFSAVPLSIAALRCDVDPLTCSGSNKPSPVFARANGWDLYRFLVQPVEAVLGDVKTLYVTTSGRLSDLPFAALITAKPEGPDSEAALLTTPWLGDRYALVNLPSVAALRADPAARPARRAAIPFVGYGAPALAAAGEARAVPAGLAPVARKDGAELADPEQLRTLPSLPGTETELKAMAQVLGAGGDAIRLGPQATEPSVRSDQRLETAGIVAFATHGLLPDELEGFAEPGLVFTPPASATAADDGVLAASEAAQLKLAADWVILSACNTATASGAGGGGDALSALARAFLYAGADALLASRWRVGDEVTAALTVETLANARRAPRAGRAAALQAAMRAIRTGRRADGSAVEGWSADWAHPAAWAPFALIADRN